MTARGAAWIARAGHPRNPCIPRRGVFSPPFVERLATRATGAIALWLGVLATSAHVGSPDVYFAGAAGPYAVRVTVRPPAVIPGRAEVTVRVAEGDVRMVTVRPVFWRTGSAGSPHADTLARIAGPEPLFDGMLWLMSRGAYTVTVTASGARGSGSVAVPVDAIATGRLAMPGATKGALIVLGVLLTLAMMSLIRAAVGESVVPSGERPDRRRVLKGRIAFAATAPLMGLILLGGARWWRSEDHTYASRMYRLMAVHGAVRTDGSRRVYRLTVVDSVWQTGRTGGPLMPDHGRMMHMFLIGDGAAAGDAFAHLHPTQLDSASFETALPPLPAGHYRVFADVVHESGFERTLVTTVDLAAPDVAQSAALDPDDAWSASVPRAAAGVTAFRDGATIAWAGAGVHQVAGTDAGLRFTVRETDGRPATLDPWLGMTGHAVVMREDGGVYIHLHPTGTAAMAAQRAFALRDRGDTTSAGRLRFDAGDDAMAGMAGMPTGPSKTPDGEVAFPYAFPSAGRYRVWVQVKHAGRIETARFDVSAAAAAAVPVAR